MRGRRVGGQTELDDTALRVPADLERTFSDATQREESSLVAAARALRQKRGEAQDWSWLLKSPLAVILNEAGAGKTWEIRRQVDRKRLAGEHAFFLPLERLARQEGDQLFESHEARAAFFRWRGSRSPATFFLDALDEAKLPSSADADPLQVALRRLEILVGEQALRRVRLVISSRPSAYKLAEEAVIARIAARFQARGVTEPCPRVVSLDPLSFEQQARLARHLSAPPEFMVQLGARWAIDLAPTPLDFEDLLIAYRAEVQAGRDGAGIFTNLAAVVERAVAWRIEGRQAGRSRSLLSPQRTREGARRLACACLLGATLAIRAPGTPGEGVDAQAVLNGRGGGWTVDDIDQLLASGLFTAAWNGRVHFHHRRTLDYLAAEAFDAQLARGLEVRALAAVLTPQAFGEVSAPPAFHGVLGWLATRNADFRHHLLAVAPQLLIEEGDPSRLPSPIRARALENHVARYRQIRWRSEWMDGARAHRFVEPALAPVIVRLLDHAQTAEEPAGHLIALAELGGLKACADALLTLACDEGREASLRARAVDALVELGGNDHWRRLKALGLTWRTPRDDPDPHARQDRNRLRFAIAAATIGVSTPRETLTLLLRLERRSKSYATLGQDGLAELIAGACLPAELPRLLWQLSRLSWARRDQPITRTEPTQWTRLGWFLLPITQAVAIRCVRERPAGLDVAFLAREVERLIEAGEVMLGALWRFDREEAPDPLLAALDAAPWLRRATFAQWLSDQSDGRASTASFHLDERAPRHRNRARFVERAAEDLAWLLEDYGDSLPGLAAEAYAFAIVDRLERLPHGDEAVGQFRKMAAARRDQAALDKTPSRLGRLRAALRMGLMRWWWNGKLRRYVRNPATLRREFRLWRARQWVRWNAARLFTPGHEALAFSTLRRHLYQKDPLAGVRGEHGAAVADGVLLAAKAYARRFTPDARTRPTSEAMRFAGLGWTLIALDDPGAIAALDEDRARAALKVGLAQSAVPAWALTLASQWLDLWREIIEAPLCAAIGKLKAGDREHASLLAMLARLDDALQRPFATIVAALIARPGCLPRDHVDDAFEIARSDPQTHQDLTRLARTQTREHLACGQVWQASGWLREWLALDGKAAWTEVRRLRDGFWRDGPVMAKLFEGLGEGLSLGSLDLDVVAMLAVDLQRHVADHEDDEEWPRDITPRDRARDLKRGILPFLSRDPSPAARAALEALREEPSFAADHGWLTRLLAEQAALAAQPRAWTSAAVAEFLDTWLRAPEDADAFLASVERQLASIVEDLRTSEFDLRGLFRQAAEKDVRAFLGAALRARGQGWFDVTQESATSAEKRTDLRLSAEVGVVIVELKLTDKTPAADLRERLENQLVGQYLISPQVRHGVFALAQTGHKQTWKLPSGALVDFAGLVAWLREEASALAAASSLGIGLSVVGLDIAPPPPAIASRASRASRARAAETPEPHPGRRL